MASFEWLCAGLITRDLAGWVGAEVERVYECGDASLAAGSVPEQ
jgi:hypothetical protein